MDGGMTNQLPRDGLVAVVNRERPRPIPPSILDLADEVMG
jgi:hypothetical protein